jgi:YidC/Oxa1 family membrane protein insertase
MNKKELYTVVVLILLIPVWLFIDARFIKPRFQGPAPVATATPQSSGESAAVPPQAEAASSGAESVSGAAARAVAPVLEMREDGVEAETRVLGNDRIEVVLSNLGAVVEQVTLKTFPETLDGEEAVVLDFSGESLPALTLSSPGLPPRAGYQIEEQADGSVEFLREVQPGLFLHRRIALGDSFELEVTDRWVNQSDVPMQLPEQFISLGPMLPRPEASQRFGPFVGVDARHTATGVQHYVKDMTKGVNQAEDGTFSTTVTEPLIWFSVKNKFFTQVLTLEPTDDLTANALEIRAEAGEGDVKIGLGEARARLAGVVLQPRQEIQRAYHYYVGPMSMTELRQLGENQEDLIDFRLFRIFLPLVRLMMSGLNTLHGFTGNWGVAIILLTFVVRMLFWPLTQKGAENMKRMSELSPQMKELREKYKSNPQKLNAEMSAFYKEHKVNPMAGCLPMLVQIPVFISLYGVLRVAVELRFAEFLWINDLSEQEALFTIAGFTVNLLPLTMGATMVLQQKLTPSNMDEQQKKIMMMMPIVFLFITYSMPSGLLLYWTTSNLISIYQTTHTRKRDAKKKAGNEKTASGSAAAKAKPVKNPKASTPGKK